MGGVGILVVQGRSSREPCSKLSERAIGGLGEDVQVTISRSTIAGEPLPLEFTPGAQDELRRNFKGRAIGSDRGNPV